jgi:GNAT superfamily N-acetyltransferase
MISIRKATILDISLIAEFQQKMALETEGIILDRNILNRGVTSVFDHPGKGFYLIAESEGESAGCMMLTPEWSDWRNGKFLWIQSLYVEPRFRQKGIFKAMYRHVQMIVAGSDEWMGLRLYVVRNNLKAMEAYSKVGMDGDHYRMFEWVK